MIARGDDERDALARRASDLIARLGEGSRDDARRDALLADIAALQAKRIEPYARLVRARGVGAAIPTDVMRYARIAMHPPERDIRVFRTSGTTSEARGIHALCDLSLYDLAARAAARHALFPDVDRIALAILAPPEIEARDSSLSYMLARFGEWFADGEPIYAMRGGALAIDALYGALDRACRSCEPIALLGTSFAFVHLEDAVASSGRAWELPRGSRIMHTGGFKGRSREVEPSALRSTLTSRFGVAASHIVAEYGMTELTSQMYETTLRDPAQGRRLWVPGWVRAVPVDPETLEPVAAGAIGILRVEDAANVDTGCLIQTSDLARREGDGIALIGRAPGATPRGCSLAIDAVLGGSRAGSETS